MDKGRLDALIDQAERKTRLRRFVLTGTFIYAAAFPLSAVFLNGQQWFLRSWLLQHIYILMWGASFIAWVLFLLWIARTENIMILRVKA